MKLCDYFHFCLKNRKINKKTALIYGMFLCLLPLAAYSASFTCANALLTPLNISEGPNTAVGSNFLNIGGSPVQTYNGYLTNNTAYLMTQGTEGTHFGFQNAGATCNKATQSCIASGEFAGVPTISMPAFPACNQGANCNLTTSGNITVTAGSSYTSITLNNTMTISGASGSIYIGTLTLNAGAAIAFSATNQYDLFLHSLQMAGANTLTVGANGTGRIYVCDNTFGGVTFRFPMNWNTGGTANQLIFYMANPFIQPVSSGCHATVGSYGGSVLGFTGGAPIINFKGIILSETPIGSGSNPNVTMTGAILAPSILINSGLTFNMTFPGATTINSTNFGSFISCLGPATQLVATPSCTCCGNTVNLTVTPTKAAGNQDVGYQKMIVLSTHDTACASTTTACCNTTTTACGSPACTRTCTAAGGVTGCVGNWTLVSGQGTFTAGATNSGYATYLFSPNDTTPPVFSLSYPTAGSPSILVYEQNRCPVFVPDAAPSQITFTGGATGGDSFTWGGITNPQIGGSAVNGATGITLTATKPAACGGGTDTSYTGTRTLEFSSTYNNPTTGAPASHGGPIQVTIGGTKIPNSGAPTTPTFSVVFTNGVSAALPAVIYADVGAITLNVLDVTTGGTIPNITCGSFCSSPQIVFEPASLVVSGTGIPGCNTPTGCTVFAKAGSPFTATVTAKITGGGTALNFGNETTQQVPTLLATLNAPSGGTLGAFSAGTPTFNGSGTGAFTFSNVTYGDVGAINLSSNIGSPTAGKYLTYALSNGPAVIVGRFQPHHFATTANAPVFAPGCSTDLFTYFGMSNSYVAGSAPVLTVTAQNASNATTVNYTGAWSFITPTSMNTNSTYSQTAQTSAPAQTPTISFGTVPNPTQASISNGVYSFTYGGTISLPVPVTASAAPYPGPFTPNISMSIAVQDGDNPIVQGSPTSCILSGPGAANSCASGGSGIVFCSTTTPCTTNQFYQGRLALFNIAASNITGSTTSMPVQVQYFNGSGWTPNTHDSHCTPLTGTNYCMNSATAPCIVGNPPQPVTVPGGNITMSGNLTSGAGYIKFAAPAGTPTGQTNFQLLLEAANQNLPWLQGYWGSTPAYTDPHAQITWGYSPGSTMRTIYQQENY